jgi:hypothetical protein
MHKALRLIPSTSERSTHQLNKEKRRNTTQGLERKNRTLIVDEKIHKVSERIFK